MQRSSRSIGRRSVAILGAGLLASVALGPGQGCSASSSDPAADPLVECAIEGRREACFSGSLEDRGTGACRDGIHECVAGSWTECDGEILPAPVDTCDNGLDDDCNGLVDDGCSCSAFDVQACYGGAADSRDVGTCRSGEQQCVGGIWSIECAGQVLPASDELCGNGLDEDCNGTADDGCADGGAGSG